MIYLPRPVGLCWVIGNCCLLPACQAVLAIDHVQVATCTATSKRQEGHLGRLRAHRKKGVKGARCGGFESFVWLRYLLLEQLSKNARDKAPIETTCISSETRRQKKLKEVNLDPQCTVRCVRTTKLARKDRQCEAPFGQLGK